MSTSRFFLVLALLLLPLAASAQDRAGTLKGTVVDAATREPLVGVNVLVVGLGLGAATDAAGAFTITAVPVGTHRLEARYLGYDPVIRTDLVVQPGRATTVPFELQESVLEGEGVTVQADYFQGSGTSPTSIAAFSAEEIRRAPGSGQEIARVLNALPGVASRGETSQDLLVRGGSPAENGFFIDNIFVPNVQHFQTGDGSSFGPTGIINTEFVDQIEFSTGGFSAAYGDRLSSISDIRYRDGAERTTGEVGVNFTGGTGILEGGLPGDRGSWFVSGRRSYLDLVAGAVDAGGAPSFADAQGKLTYRLSPRHRLTVLNLFGTSRFEQVPEDAVEDGTLDFIDVRNVQNTIGANWQALWNGGFTNTSASYSLRRRDFVSRFADSGSRRLDEEIGNQYLNLRSTSLARLSPRVQVEFGGEVMVERGSYDYARDAYTARNGDEQPGFDRDVTITDTRAGGFVSTTLQPLPRLRATVGARSDYYTLSSTVTVSPRVSAAYDLTDRLALNASAGIFRQAVPLFLTSFDAANEDLRPLRADHYIAGLSYLLTPDTRVTVEAFAKEYSDLPQYAPGNPQADPGFVLDSRGNFAGALDSSGEAYARGVELMVQKKLAEKVYGLLSASYFRARYRDAEGTWRNRDYDTRLLFSAVGGYKPNDRWEISARWSYLGDRPFTPVDADASLAANDEVLDIDRFNEERLPAYHSLFVRVDRRFFFPRSSLVAFVSLWNAYNRANVESEYWNFTEGRVDEQTQFSLLPIVGFEYEF